MDKITDEQLDMLIDLHKYNDQRDFVAYVIYLAAKELKEYREKDGKEK